MADKKITELPTLTDATANDADWMPIVDTSEMVTSKISLGEMKLRFQGNPGPTGATGPTGGAGPTGAPGAGVPVGGTTGQALVKKSNDDRDTEWKDFPTSLPPGGDADQVLTKQTNADGDAIWKDAPIALPPGGAEGEYLRKKTAGDGDAEWAEVSVDGKLDKQTDIRHLYGTDDAIPTPNQVMVPYSNSTAYNSIAQRTSVGQLKAFTAPDGDVDATSTDLANRDYVATKISAIKSYESVANLSARNLIPSGSRFDGFIAFVQDLKTNFQLRGGTTNSFWVPLFSNGYSQQLINAPGMSIVVDLYHTNQVIQLSTDSNYTLDSLPFGSYSTAYPQKGAILTILGPDSDFSITIPEATSGIDGVRGGSVILGRGSVARYIYSYVLGLWLLM